jgi:hypothetical protein
MDEIIGLLAQGRENQQCLPDQAECGPNYNANEINKKRRKYTSSRIFCFIFTPQILE